MDCELIVNQMHIHNRHYEAECAQGTLALWLVSHVMLYSPYPEISGQSCSRRSYIIMSIEQQQWPKQGYSQVCSRGGCPDTEEWVGQLNTSVNI